MIIISNGQKVIENIESVLKGGSKVHFLPITKRGKNLKKIIARGKKYLLPINKINTKIRD